MALRLTRAGREPGRVVELIDFASKVSATIRDGRLTSGIALCNAFAMAGTGKPRQAEELAVASFDAALADELRLHMARSALFRLRLAAREDLDFPGAVGAFKQLNAEDLGPLAADAELAFAEYAVHHNDPSGPGRLHHIMELAVRRGLSWYRDEVLRITTLARTKAIIPSS